MTAYAKILPEALKSVHPIAVPFCQYVPSFGGEGGRQRTTAPVVESCFKVSERFEGKRSGGRTLESRFALLVPQVYRPVRSYMTHQHL